MRPDANIYPPLQWNQLYLEAIRCSVSFPTLTARVLGIVHTAIYDAWSAFKEEALSTLTAQYVKILYRRYYTSVNIHKAYSYAAYRALIDLFWLVLSPETKDIYRVQKM